MEWNISDFLILIPLFFTIAMLYSSVGFGGGSSYIAILALYGVSHLTIAQAALLCNIVVVASSSYLFFKNRMIDLREAVPYAIASVPMAFVGGAVPIDKKTYLTLLCVVLFYSGMKILIVKKGAGKKQDENLQAAGIFETEADESGAKGAANQSKRHSLPASLAIGGAVGFTSGLIGIGGGIILAPILHLAGRLNARSIAAISAFFILVNSISGFAGQLTKSGFAVEAQWILPLIGAVFLGGRLGIHFSLKKLSEFFVKQATAILVLFVSFRIFYQTYLRFWVESILQ